MSTMTILVTILRKILETGPVSQTRRAPQLLRKCNIKVSELSQSQTGPFLSSPLSVLGQTARPVLSVSVALCGVCISNYWFCVLSIIFP